jgi:capsular polysaccharide biosynthesis protein
VSSSAASDQAVDLRLVRLALRRHRRLIVAVTVLGAALGAGIAALTPPGYASTSVVLISPSPLDLQSGVLEKETYAELAQSKPVLLGALERAGSSQPLSQLESATRVSTSTPQLVEITVADADPSAAAVMSAAVAETFVQYVRDVTSSAVEQADADVQAQITELSDRAAQVDDELVRLRERIARAPTTPRAQRNADVVAALVAQRADLAVEISRLNNLRQQRAQEAGPGAIPIRVLQAGADATQPSPLVHAIQFAVGGGLLAAAASLMWAMRRTRVDQLIRSRQSLARALGAPVVGELTARPQRTPEGWRDLLAHYEPPSADVWAVRLLLRSLTMNAQPGGAAGRTGPPCVVVTAMASDRRGLSLGPVIAVAAASMGVRTTMAGVGDPGEAVDLWAGMALLRHGGHRRANLSVANPDDRDESDLHIALVVVHPDLPRFDDVPPPTAHVLAFSAGAAGVEDVARIALAADTAGQPITGAVLTESSDVGHQPIAAPAAHDVSRSSPSEASDRSAVPAGSPVPGSAR